MSANIIGATSAVEQRSPTRCDAVDGERTLTVYSGPYDAVRAIYETARQQMGSSWESISFDPNGATAKLTLTPYPNRAYSALATSQIAWELLAQEELINVENHAAFNSLSAADVMDCYKLAADTTNTQTPAGWSTEKSALYQMIYQGKRQVYETRYILRKTITCNSLATVSVSYAGVGTVVTPPTAGGLITALPDGEWLLKAPNVRQIGNMPWQNRWQLVQEWWWAKKWSHILYGGTLYP